MKHLQYLRKALIDLYKRVIGLYGISDSNFNQCQLLAEERNLLNTFQCLLCDIYLAIRCLRL